MVANTILLIIAAIRRKRTGLFYFIPMLIGLPYFLSTVGIKSYFRGNDPSAPDFTVLDYNISNFGVKVNKNTDKKVAEQELYDLVINPTTDIQCYQEFI